MKKILFLAMSLGSGGAERQMVTVARLLKERGYNIIFLCYAKGDFYAHLLEQDNIPIIWMVENNYLKRIHRIRNHIRKGHYDTVISFLSTSNFLNNFSAIGGKSWKVITGERSAKEQTFNSLKGKIFAWFQRYSDYIVCNSNNARKMWEKHYPQYKNKLSVIYNTVLLPEITAEYIPKRDDKLHVIIAASYQYLKNSLGLIEAIALMSEDEKEKLKVEWYGKKNVSYGGTKAYDESMLKIKEFQLENIITLNKTTKDIANKMKEADVVALFSELEGLPNAICEGMMIGKPIVMTKVSDFNELVNEKNGKLCDWDKPETIKNALVYMIELSEKELMEMGEQSHHKANQLFSKENITDKWMTLIKKS